MSNDPPATVTAASPPSASAVLSWMQNSGTVTEGWDVVCAMAFDKVNEFFLQQYVERMLNQEYIQIDGSVPGQAAGISIEFSDLLLGAPLIQFKSSMPQNTVSLTVNFIQGEVNVLQKNGAVTTLLSVQTVTPSDSYVLTGLVPLTSVKGEVENKHDVVIDIVNGKNFAAGLNLPAGAETLIGQYIIQWLTDNSKDFKYKLGTLDYSNNNTNLTPAGTFEFGTQSDASDPTDAGRLLLFVPTTYNPGGGSQKPLGLANVVPQGYSAALFISSKAFFQGILAPFYTSAFQKLGGQAAPSQNANGSYALTFTAGGLNVGCQASPSLDSADRQWTGLPSTLGSPEQDDDVIVPLAPIRIAAGNNQLQITGSPQWQQSLAYQEVLTRGFSGAETFTFTAKVSCSATASVAAVTDLISFTGDTQVDVSSDANGWENWDWGNLERPIAASATAGLKQLFNITLPQVNAFAVSNLLFPGKNALKFQSAYLPGDIAIFGDVVAPFTITPAAVTLASNQTQQFSITGAGSDAVTWKGPQYGSVSNSGLYTAPQVFGSMIDKVVAQDTKTGATAAAIITLVQTGVQVSPACALMTPATAPQKFVAAVSGAPSQEVVWSLSPAQAGSITNDGLYTPAKTVASPQAVTIKATSASNSSIQGTATVMLLSSLPTGVAVTPYDPWVTVGLTTQFAAAVSQVQDQSVAWNLVPPQGSGKITADGLYVSPGSIATNPQWVLVVATSKSNPSLFGTALLKLQE